MQYNLEREVEIATIVELASDIVSLHVSTNPFLM
jgi:predicted transcriptional regulator